MPIGLLFWMLMILWIISWVSHRWGGWAYGLYASEFFMLVLFFLLGWHNFGFILKYQ